MSIKEEDRGFMQSFWELPSTNPVQRVAASSTIVAHLVAQAALPDEDGLDEEGNVGKDTVADLPYALKRLTGGLNSSRSCARQGFALALGEALRMLPEDVLSTKTVVEAIESKTAVTGVVRGDEERDRRFGRIFGYLAVLRSGRLSKDGAAAAVAASATKRIVTGLLSMAGKKKWLGQLCYQVIVDICAARAKSLGAAWLCEMLPLLAPQVKAAHP